MKKTVLTLLIGLVIGIAGTVIASNYLASEIVYNDTTVEDALNELYDRSNASVYTGETSITPTEAEQTISSNGKRFTSDITIGAIPNTYKNLTSNTTVIPERLFEGVTAYNNLGELVTGSINPNCVGGNYVKSSNSFINIDVGFKPSKFFVQFVVKSGGNLHNIIYNSSLSSTSYDHYFASDGTFANTQTDILTISNNKIIDSSNQTDSNRYKNSYTVYYMACK